MANRDALLESINLIREHCDAAIDVIAAGSNLGEALANIEAETRILRKDSGLGYIYGEAAITIDPTAWEWNANDEYPEWVRGLATVIVNGTYMHLEAWAVYTDADGIQRAYDPYDDDLSNLHLAVHGDGHFHTTTINDRQYVVVASPFC